METGVVQEFFIWKRIFHEVRQRSRSQQGTFSDVLQIDPMGQFSF